MHDELVSLYDRFWNSKYWLPPNITWQDFDNANGIRYPHSKDLLLVFPLTLCFYIVRLCFLKYFATPLSEYLGIKDKFNYKALHKYNALVDEELNSQFRKTRWPNDNVYIALSKRCDISITQVKKWFRQKRNLSRPSPRQKFLTCSWICFFYTCSFIYGLTLIPNNYFIFDPVAYFKRYPFQPLQSSYYVYYLLECTYYLFAFFSLIFIDPHKKDFYLMLIHHVITLALLYFSWIINLVHCGVFVLVLHDASDPIVETIKMLKYANRSSTCLPILLVIVVWFFTRLFIFPWRIVWLALVHVPRILNTMYRAYYVFNALLLILLLFHVIWFLLMLKVLSTTISSGKFVKDERSSTEDTEPSSS